MYSFRTNPEQAKRAYDESGYHIEHNVLSEVECKAFIEAGMSLQAAKEGNYTPAMMPHREDPLFLDALKSPVIVDIMSHIVGGRPSGLQTEFFYCKPGTRGFSLHQDNYFVEAPLGVFASAWIALTDTYPKKGGLIVYPGTHKEGLLPVKKLSLHKDANQDPNANNEETVVPPQYVALNAVVPRGAALFIHGHLVHGSNKNQTDEYRYVLLNTYIRQGEKFRPGKYAQRAEVALS